MYSAPIPTIILFLINRSVHNICLINIDHLLAIKWQNGNIMFVYYFLAIRLHLPMIKINMLIHLNVIPTILILFRYFIIEIFFVF